MKQRLLMIMLAALVFVVPVFAVDELRMSNFSIYDTGFGSSDICITMSNNDILWKSGNFTERNSAGYVSWLESQGYCSYNASVSLVPSLELCSDTAVYRAQYMVYGAMRFILEEVVANIAEQRFSQVSIPRVVS